MNEHQIDARVDAPREIAQLMLLSRGLRYVIGRNMGIFTGTDDETSFLSGTSEEQCQRLREQLIRRDIEGWPDQGRTMPITPIMPDASPQQTESVSPVPENTMQPPQFRPVIPSTVGQQVQQPTQMPVYQQQQQQPPSMPTMGGMSMGMPPQMPTAHQPMPVGLPQMQAPQWQLPQQAAAPMPMPQAVLPSGRAPAAPSTPQTGLGDVLTKIAEVQAANQKMLEAIHRHQLESTALLLKVIGMLITTPQMQGVPLDVLVQSVAQAGGEEQVKSFLQATGSPNQGKA